MTEKSIYTITTIRIALAAGKRCVGFYYDYPTAEDAVINNCCDINEMDYYPYAVIEEVKAGIYTFPRPEFWYKWNTDRKKYEPCPKPERFLKASCWGIG